MRRPIVVASLAMLVLAAVVFPARLRERSASHTCAYNLRSMGCALANYRDTYNCYPCPVINDVSWRIRIMPHVMASPLHMEYKYDEPWNSQKNLELHKRPLRTHDGSKFVFGVPSDFHCNWSSRNETDASYLLFVGPNAFANPIGHRKIDEITDGLENTIIAAESISELIHWLEPKDIDVSAMSFKINDSSKMCISSHHIKGPAVLFADCAVYRLSPSTPEDVVHAMITINGGELATRESLIESGYLLPE